MVPRARNVDVDDLLDPPGPGGHDRHAIGEKDRFLQIVGNEENGLALEVVELEEMLLHDALRQGVKRPERLVEQQHFGIAHEGAHDLDPPLLAPGQRFGKLIVDALEPDPAHQLACLVRRFRHLRLAALYRPGSDVPQHRLPREQRTMLKDDHPVGAGKQLLSRRSEKLAIHVDCAGGKLIEPGDGVQQGRLSASRRPHDHAELTGRNAQRHVVDRDHVDAPGIVYLPGVRDLQSTNGSHHTPESSFSRHRMSRFPAMRTSALERYPNSPSVAMVLIIVGNCT